MSLLCSQQNETKRIHRIRKSKSKSSGERFLDLEAGEDIDASSSSMEDNVPDAAREKTPWAAERLKGRKELVMTAIIQKYERIAKVSQPKKKCAKNDEVFISSH